MCKTLFTFSIAQLFGFHLENFAPQTSDLRCFLCSWHIYEWSINEMIFVAENVHEPKSRQFSSRIYAKIRYSKGFTLVCVRYKTTNNPLLWAVLFTFHCLLNSSRNALHRMKRTNIKSFIHSHGNCFDTKKNQWF